MWELVQTYGSWFLFVLFVMLMLRIHGGMDHDQHGQQTTPDQTPPKAKAAPESGPHPTNGGAAELAVRRPSPWALLIWFAVWIGSSFSKWGRSQRPWVEYW